MSGTLDYYCNADDLKIIGNGLANFPKHIGDEYKYEIGSPNPKDRWAYHFMLRAITINMSGHCALQVVMNNNRHEPPDACSCNFSIKAEPAAINRLGNLFLRFADLNYRKFTWTETEESLD
jgi:hypothetical protein